MESCQKEMIQRKKKYLEVKGSHKNVNHKLYFKPLKRYRYYWKYKKN